MKDYSVGRFKGRKTTHLFDTIAKYSQPLCNRKPEDRFKVATIEFPMTNPEVTCRKCRRILYGS